MFKTTHMKMFDEPDSLIVYCDTTIETPLPCDDEWSRPYLVALDTALDGGLVSMPGQYRIYKTEENGIDVFNVKTLWTPPK